MATTERILPPRYDKNGHVYWESSTSPPNDSVAVCYMIPDRIIPVIFIPGVMGSNLADQDNKAIWLLDSIRELFSKWVLKKPDQRKIALDPLKTRVYFNGKIPQGTKQSDEELRRRGWGSVAHASYGEFLVWLENNLHDYETCKSGVRHLLRNRMDGKNMFHLSFEEVALSYKYRFPVHAVGYNWLQSNADSAKYLHTKIQEFILHYTKLKFSCEKIILVTHSMGGLVARYYSEVLSQEEPYKQKGLREQILGVVHGVMPATGAAATYKRIKAGFEGLGSLVLGDDAAAVTAVMGNAPGPLQLLPSVDYGMGWLKLKDADGEKKFPKANPYTEIYTVRNKWWGLINDQLLNPLDSQKLTLEEDWEKFISIINDDVATFHHAISRKYHPESYVFYGQDKKHKTYGDVCWRSTAAALFLNSQDAQAAEHDRPHSDKGLGKQEVRIKIDRHTTSPSYGGPYIGALTGAIPPRVAKTHLSAGQRTNSCSAYNFLGTTYEIQEMEEEGDGTVPVRSGAAPSDAGPNVKVCFPFAGIEHEAAYAKQYTRSFTLWAITKIAQKVKGTSLDYK